MGASEAIWEGEWYCVMPRTMEATAACITSFFLDDGLATRTWRAVKFFLELLKEGLDDKGLKMCLEKT